MHLRNALVNLALETATDTAITEAARDERVHQQWMTAIDAFLRDLTDETGATDAAVDVDTTDTDLAVIVITVDNDVVIRVHGNLDAPMGLRFERAWMTVDRTCPNPDCVWPDRRVELAFDGTVDLAEKLLGPIPAHFYCARRCDGVTAEDVVIDNPIVRPVIVLREHDCTTATDPRTFEERFDELVRKGYRWHVCCTDSHEHGLTVVAVYP